DGERRADRRHGGQLRPQSLHAQNDRRSVYRVGEKGGGQSTRQEDTRAAHPSASPAVGLPVGEPEGQLIVAAFRSWQDYEPEVFWRLASSLFLQRQWSRAPRGPAGAVAKRSDVELQLGDGAAQSVTVHAQFAGSLALIAMVSLQDGQDEAPLELADCFRIQDSALVHLGDESFKLIFHRSLSCKFLAARTWTPPLVAGGARIQFCC